MSALMVVTIKVKDSEKLKTYMEKVQIIAADYDAEMVAKGQHATSLTKQNSEAHHMVTIIKFPSIAQQESWFNSPAYQSIIPLRQEAAEMSMNVYQTM